jgi:hypothetical protein
MREVTVRVTCDACPPRDPADATVTVRIDLGDGQRESDLCTEHAAALTDAVRPFLLDARAISASGRCRRR